MFEKLVKYAGSAGVKALVRSLYASKAAEARRTLAARGMTDGPPLEIVPFQGIFAASPLPATLLADLRLNRRGAYIEPLLVAWDAHLDRLLGLAAPEKITVPSDAELLRMILYSSLSFYLRKEPEDQVYTLDMTRLERLPFFDGHCEIHEARIDRAAGTFVFRTTYGRDFDRADPLYDLAKLHFISCSYAFQPYISHSWVHFNFPDIISTLHFNLGVRSPDSVLYKLLRPHTRFGLALAESVLRTDRISVNNDEGWKKRLNPITPMPTRFEDFLAANSGRTADFYAEGGGFHCPPRFDSDLPYIQTALRFYDVVRTFVGEMAPLLEEDLLAEMMTQASAHLPAIGRFDKLDVLATFIWQVSVLHSSDHFAFYKAYCHDATAHDDITALKGKPIYPTLMTRSLRECTAETTLDEVADPVYTQRVRNHMAIFTRYNPVGDLNLRNLSYGFGAPAPDEAAARFQADLIALEEALIAEDRLICPLVEMAPSICF